MIAALVYAGRLHADAINMSLGAYVDMSLPGIDGLISDLQEAVDFATSPGSVVVAAAGNDGNDLDQDAPTWIELPAQLPNVLSIGATAPINRANFDMLASYSNNGGRTGIDFVSRGGDFVTGSVPSDLISLSAAATKLPSDSLAARRALSSTPVRVLRPIT